MSKPLKRWCMLVAAIATALAVMLGAAVPAFAAEPGEESSWTNEPVNNGADLQSPDTYSEAYDPAGNIVQVFRGLDNHVWIGSAYGVVFNAGGGTNTTVTYVAPRVLYSNGWFYAFHTGTDNRVYWSRVVDGYQGTATNWSPWEPIAGNAATTQSVSVTSAPGWGLMMVWVGVGQTTMYSAWLPNGSDTFQGTEQVYGASSDNAPTVYYNQADQAFELAYRGLDSRVYLTSQSLGAPGWPGGQIVYPGLSTETSPTVSVDPYGNLLLAAVDENARVWFWAENSNLQSYGWRQENTGYQTVHPVWLTIVGRVFYICLTALRNNEVYFKSAWDAQNGI